MHGLKALNKIAMTELQIFYKISNAYISLRVTYINIENILVQLF